MNMTTLENYEKIDSEELAEIIGGITAYQAGYAAGRAIAVAATVATFAAL
ncbi:ComC/BlpC family leader-containing pheromone/bacteriocin [Streptococcus troglodytae]|uniref:Uncharacterized protein n=1 Tax=Streptococcus troglodytae TaxID=1111760 RepID=A0A1L7LGN4_9STRE|nr:ComC/BlpC family leader-containing pheromone/bacteriocin [Streptococcus troglodytae]BAQ23289.1 putative uncharacterized protein [Streptococcus troglodytae]